MEDRLADVSRYLILAALVELALAVLTSLLAHCNFQKGGVPCSYCSVISRSCLIVVSVFKAGLV